MKHEIDIFEEFGPRLANGAEAYQFRVQTLESYFNICDVLVIDFSKVRISNSSFMNALLASLFEHDAPLALEKLEFRGCQGVVKIMVEAAIDLGVSKYENARQLM